MSNYSDRAWANKIEWEGGIIEAIFGYGLHADDLDDKTTDLYKSAKTVDDILNGEEFRDAIRSLEDELDKLDEETV